MTPILLLGQISIECLINEELGQPWCYDCTDASDTVLFTGFRIIHAGVDTTMIEAPWRLKVRRNTDEWVFFDYRDQVKFAHVDSLTDFSTLDELIDYVQDCQTFTVIYGNGDSTRMVGWQDTMYITYPDPGSGGGPSDTTYSWPISVNGGTPDTIVNLELVNLVAGTNLTITHGTTNITFDADDNQNVVLFDIMTNTLRLDIENDGQPIHTVDLSPYLDDTDTDTDSQSLSLIGDILAITRGNSVDLNKYTNDTIYQILSYIKNGQFDTISISDGNSIYLFDQDSQTLSINADSLFITRGNHVLLDEYRDTIKRKPWHVAFYQEDSTLTDTTAWDTLVLMNDNVRWLYMNDSLNAVAIGKGAKADNNFNSSFGAHAFPFLDDTITESITNTQIDTVNEVITGLATYITHLSDLGYSTGDNVKIKFTLVSGQMPFTDSAVYMPEGEHLFNIASASTLAPVYFEFDSVETGSYELVANQYITHSTAIGAQSIVDRNRQVALGDSLLEEVKFAKEIRFDADTNFTHRQFYQYDSSSQQLHPFWWDLENNGIVYWDSGDYRTLEEHLHFDGINNVGINGRPIAGNWRLSNYGGLAVVEDPEALGRAQIRMGDTTLTDWYWFMEATDETYQIRSYSKNGPGELVPNFQIDTAGQLWTPFYGGTTFEKSTLATNDRILLTDANGYQFNINKTDLASELSIAASADSLGSVHDLGDLLFGSDSKAAYSSPNLHYDSTNIRLGIGTSAPDETIHAKTTGNTSLKIDAGTVSLADFIWAQNGVDKWRMGTDGLLTDLYLYRSSDNAGIYKFDLSSLLATWYEDQRFEKDITLSAFVGTAKDQATTKLLNVNASGVMGTVDMASIIPTGTANTVAYFNGVGDLASESGFGYVESTNTQTVENLTVGNSSTDAFIITSGGRDYQFRTASASLFMEPEIGDVTWWWRDLADASIFTISTASKEGYYYGDFRLGAGLKDGAGSAGVSGQVLSTTGTLTSWINVDTDNSNEIQQIDVWSITSGGTGGTISLSPTLDATTYTIDIEESVEDLIAGNVVGGTGISASYNDGTGRLTLTNTGVITEIDGSTTNELDTWNLDADGSASTNISNGETVSFIGGTNVTTSRSGNNITISASGGAADELGTVITNTNIVYGQGSDVADQDADFQWNDASNTLFIGSGTDIDDAAGMTFPSSYGFDNSSGEAVNFTSSQVSTLVEGATQHTVTNGLTTIGNNMSIGESATDKIVINSGNGYVGISENSDLNSYLRFYADGRIQLINSSSGTDDDIDITSFGDLTLTSSGSSVIMDGTTIEMNGGVTGSFQLEVNGTASKTGGGTWSIPSDSTFKKNIIEIDSAYNKILGLNPVTYQFKDELQDSWGVGERTYTGYIAQEYQEIFPEDVTAGEDGKLSLAADAVGPYTVAAVQQLIKDKEALEAIVAKQEDRLLALENALIKPAGLSVPPVIDKHGIKITIETKEK